MPIEARLERTEDGGFTLELSVAGEGTLWQFGDFLKLERLEIDLTAAT